MNGDRRGSSTESESIVSISSRPSLKIAVRIGALHHGEDRFAKAGTGPRQRINDRGIRYVEQPEPESCVPGDSAPTRAETCPS